MRVAGVVLIICRPPKGSARPSDRRTRGAELQRAIHRQDLRQLGTEVEVESLNLFHLDLKIKHQSAWPLRRKFEAEIEPTGSDFRPRNMRGR